MREKVMLVVAMENASTIIIKEKEPDCKRKLVPVSVKPFDMAMFVNFTKIHIAVLQHIDIMYNASIRSAIASRISHVQKFKGFNLRKEWLYFAGIHSICNRKDSEIPEEITMDEIPHEYAESYLTLTTIARCVEKRYCALFILKEKQAAVLFYRFNDGRIAIIGGYGDLVERILYNMFNSTKTTTDSIPFISYAPIELRQPITNAAYRVGFIVEMSDLPARNPLACISYYANFTFIRKPTLLLSN
jgi:hypothetical protein